jgi:hypothetical protein
MPETRSFQESRMSGNLLVRFDEGRVGRASLSPSLLLYQFGRRYSDLDNVGLPEEVAQDRHFV